MLQRLIWKNYVHYTIESWVICVPYCRVEYIPSIMDQCSIPSNIKLEINRKLGKNQWKTDEVMHILKVEIEARGNCHFHKSESRNREGGDDRRGMKIGSFTTESLITNNRVIKCAFCKQTHYSDRWPTVTDVGARKEVVYNQKLCYFLSYAPWNTIFNNQ